MSDPPDLTAESSPVLPPTIRAELTAPRLPRRPWYRSLAPAYLMLFVWAPYFDRLWVGDLPRAGLGWLVGSALLAAALCFLLFYGAPATWGLRTRRRLSTVAASTFGTLGSEWITGVAIGVAEVVWYAVAIDYAIEYTLLGLAACGLIVPTALGRWFLGPLVLRSPVFLCTAAFWIFITGMANILRLAGVVVALMRVYAPVALLLLTLTALWFLPGLGTYQTEDAALLATASGAAAPGGSTGSMVRLVLGFFALVGLMSVDWGTASRRGRDVALGGLAGIVLAASWSATLALVIVAGAVGRLRVAGRLWEAMAAEPPLPPLSFRWAVWHGMGGRPAGAILILLGLVALAPACWCAALYSRRLAAHWSGLPRFHWTWIGAATAFLLIAMSWAGRLEAIDHVMGLVFAPAVGAMAGDFLRQRGGWAGPRDGLNPPGLIAWAAGLIIPPAFEVATSLNPEVWAWLPPAPIVGFLAAVIAYGLLAELGLERPPIPLGSLEAIEVRDEAEADTTAATAATAKGGRPTPSG